VAISCKLMVKEGMRITELATELTYCLRDLGLERRKEQRDEKK
jgi:hypothetical protein